MQPPFSNGSEKMLFEVPRFTADALHDGEGLLTGRLAYARGRAAYDAAQPSDLAAVTATMRRKRGKGAATRPAKRTRLSGRFILREVMKAARREPLWYPSGVQPTTHTPKTQLAPAHEQTAAQQDCAARMLAYFEHVYHGRLAAGETTITGASLLEDGGISLVPLPLRSLGFLRPTPIQVAVASAFRRTPHCRDLLVCAPTGAGKTLAYLLPLRESLAGCNCLVRAVRALVLVPTRDLAAQVAAVGEVVLGSAGLRVILAAGASRLQDEARAVAPGAASNHDTQVAGCVTEASADVVVATPGRLMLHLSSEGSLSLRHLRYLVIDEADRMLRQQYNEFVPAVARALAAAAARTLPQAGTRGAAAGVRKILLSATIPRGASKLAKLELRQPLHVTPGGISDGETDSGRDAAGSRCEQGGTVEKQMMEFGGQNDVAEVSQAIPRRHVLPRLLEHWRVECHADNRTLLLARLLWHIAACDSSMQTIVFVSSVEMTHRLAVLLRLLAEENQAGFPCVAEYSSRLSQSARAAALLRFRQSDVSALVASDAATRGLDVSGVGVVINYNAPTHARTYVHRAGRTARAGACGAVFTLLEGHEQYHFKKLMREKLACESKTYYLPGEKEHRQHFAKTPEAIQQGPAASAPVDVAVGGKEGGNALRSAYAVALGRLKATLDAEAATHKRVQRRGNRGS